MKLSLTAPNRTVYFCLSMAMGAGLLLYSPKVVKADLTVTTPAKTDALEFSISDQTINSWKGAFQLPEYTAIARQTVSLSAALESAVLGAKPKTATTKTYRYSPEKVYAWVNSIAPLFINESIEPVFKLENNRVSAFTPPRIGQRLNLYTSTKAILDALEQNQKTVTVTVREIEPKTKLSELNNLGINELIGIGTSTFNGSPKNRRTNIAVGITKVSGIVLKPGEEFSFNKYLGPVEAEYGFVPELVIKRSGTVPELGGGLCQVSSTTFRAAMNAGLPITQRRNHSYAVQYYAPQGTDATIYPGVIDLKFMNDTKGHLLIWAYLKNKDTLVYEIYGTKDNRKIIIDKPIQYDKKTNGAMKATWSRIVTKDGIEKKDVFNSTYLPPALFQKEETFVPATPPAEAPSF
jgi:vancomycin resistance protein YoaR